MKTLVLFFLIFSACSSPLEIAEVVELSRDQGGEVITSKSCELLIYFGSYGAGTNKEAYQAVLDNLKTSPKVTKLSYWYSGKEGEVSLCASLKKGSFKRAYNQVLSLLEKHESKRSPVSISHLDKVLYQSSKSK